MVVCVCFEVACLPTFLLCYIFVCRCVCVVVVCLLNALCMHCCVFVVVV